MPIVQIIRQNAANCRIIFDEVDDEMFVIAHDIVELRRRFVERMQDVKAAFIGGKPRARHFHAAKFAHTDFARCLPAPRAAHVFEPNELLRSMGDEIFDDILVAKPIASRHRIFEVIVERIATCDDACGAPLGGNRMATHRINLRNQGYLHLGRFLSRRNRGA